MTRSDRCGTLRPDARGLLLQRMLNSDNLKGDCGGAVTAAAMALRNSIRAVALTLFDIAQPRCVASLSSLSTAQIDANIGGPN
jgi:hypothetical protein